MIGNSCGAGPPIKSNTGYAGNEVSKNRRTTGGTYALGIELFFDGHRDSMHRAAVVPRTYFLVGLAGIGQSLLCGDGDIGMQNPVELTGAL